jgi:hypothetical protein
MTMRSTIAEDSHSTLTAAPIGSAARLDRVAAATLEQLKSALIFLSAFSPDAFDYAMDAAEPPEDDSSADAEPEPLCAVCGGTIGIFLKIGLDWQHFAGDGITAGEQKIYDPGHAPVVSWNPSADQ